MDNFFDTHIQTQNQLIDAIAPGYTARNESQTFKLLLQGLSCDKIFGSVILTIYLTGIPKCVEELRIRVQTYESNINLTDPALTIQGVEAQVRAMPRDWCRACGSMGYLAIASLRQIVICPRLTRV